MKDLFGRSINAVGTLIGLILVQFLVRKILSQFKQTENFKSCLPSRAVDDRCFIGQKGKGPQSRFRVFTATQCKLLQGTLQGVRCSTATTNFTKKCGGHLNSNSPSFCTVGSDNGATRTLTRDECTLLNGTQKDGKCIASGGDDLQVVCASLNTSTSLSKSDCEVILKGTWSTDGICKSSEGKIQSKTDVTRAKSAAYAAGRKASQDAITNAKKSLTDAQSAFQTALQAALSATSPAATAQGPATSALTSASSMQQQIKDTTAAAQAAVALQTTTKTKKNQDDAVAALAAQKTAQDKFNTAVNQVNAPIQDFSTKAAAITPLTTAASAAVNNIDTVQKSLIQLLNLNIQQAQTAVNDLTNLQKTLPAATTTTPLSPVDKATNDLVNTDLKNATDFLSTLQSTLKTIESSDPTKKATADVTAATTASVNLVSAASALSGQAASLKATAAQAQLDSAAAAPPPPPPVLSEQLLQILSTKYGMNCPTPDTTKINTQIKGNCEGKPQCDFSLDYSAVGGDPSPNCGPAGGPDLTINQSCDAGQTELTKNYTKGTVVNGTRINVDCPIMTKSILQNQTWQGTTNQNQSNSPNGYVKDWPQKVTVKKNWTVKIKFTITRPFMTGGSMALFTLIRESPTNGVPQPGKHLFSMFLQTDRLDNQDKVGVFLGAQYMNRQLVQTDPVNQIQNGVNRRDLATVPLDTPIDMTISKTSSEIRIQWGESSWQAYTFGANEPDMSGDYYLWTPYWAQIRPTGTILDFQFGSV